MPLQLTLQAVHLDKPEYPLADVDIVTSADTLLRLLDFIRGRGKPQTILVELRGKTVFLHQWDGNKIWCSRYMKRARAFVENYTTLDESVDGSALHQRILEYDIQGLKCLVRCNVEGYLPERVSQTDHPAAVSTQSESEINQPEPGQPRTIQDETETNLTDAAADETETEAPLEDVDAEALARSIESRFGFREQVRTGISLKELWIQRGGRHIPQDALFDVATYEAYRAGGAEGQIKKDLPRAWMARVPYLIIGYANGTRFTRIRHEDMRERFEHWETANALELARFAALLQYLVEFARGSEFTFFEVERNEGDLGTLHFVR
jgi:hypothetical protein